MAKKDKIGLCNDCDKQMVRTDDTWVRCPDVQPHPDRVEKAFSVGWSVIKEEGKKCGGKVTTPPYSGYDTTASCKKCGRSPGLAWKSGTPCPWKV